LENAGDLLTTEDGLAHIKKRKSVLGAVVLSGGEPCLYEELPDIIGEIKKIKGPSLRVKLDTNGLFPAMLEKIFAREETRPDYIALDLKIAPNRYKELAGNAPDRDLEDKLIQSAALIRESGIAHEYRTLALPPGFITEKDIEALACLADDAPWYFRSFRAGNCLDPAWNSLEENPAESAKFLKVLSEKAKKLGKQGIIV